MFEGEKAFLGREFEIELTKTIEDGLNMFEVKLMISTGMDEDIINIDGDKFF